MKNTGLYSIKYWAHEDKPREKLLLHGAKSLSDAELLAIIIGSGSANEDALSLSRRILSSCKNSLDRVSKLSLDQLSQFKGIGKVKAITIIASLELRQRKSDSSEKSINKITCSKDAYNILKGSLSHLGHEEFWILLLNNANKVLDCFQLSKGGITGTLVDCRLVFKKAISYGATAIILAHNHPSGNTKPSNEDKKITAKIKQGAQLLDIKILDHVIVTENTYFSFADEGIL